LGCGKKEVTSKKRPKTPFEKRGRFPTGKHEEGFQTGEDKRTTKRRLTKEGGRGFKGH